MSLRSEMVENGYHWDSKVECIIATSPTALAKMINEFYKARFVVGTQIFPDEEHAVWVSFVYYKVKP